MSPYIEVTDLSVAVGAGHRVVDGVSFHVGEGERLGIIGESGSGKSVTTLAMLGLLPRTLRAGGSILIDGQQVVGAPERALQSVRGVKATMVFQDPSTALDPLARVEKLIAEPILRHRGLRGSALSSAVKDALAEVSLPADDRLLRAFPHEISGGQRQRVAIAAALACRPRVLIADEPTTALDVTVQAEILDLLTRVADAHGMGLVFVSHDIAVVSATVERAIVMRSGKVVEEGPVGRLIEEPQDAYTQRLIGSARALDAALTTGRIG